MVNQVAPASDEVLAEVALTRPEYEAIVDRLGREPGPLELGLFGALWSEHCGYKHTKALLRTLPNTSDRLLVEQGAENAGVVDIGDGQSIAFKIESHNHPSAVEPVQGAATGVGGIVRDILAMGARPIALMNSLRFGDPGSERTRHLVSEVIEGISNYGNCIGVPNVGGEIEFHDSYNDNPLVNVMCVGLIEGGRVMSARAESPGDLLVIVGAKTGRDGIHGASGLASRTFGDEAEMRPAVQVGNPFLEKVLIEACLEAVELPCVVGMQDCGAAGITSAAIEMAARSDMGITIDVQKVPQRESDMNAYEIMLSESQERMLLAVKPTANDALFALFDKWDLDSAIIGEFTNGSDVVVTFGGNVHCTTPVKVLTDPPEYVFNAPKPPDLDVVQRFNPPSMRDEPFSREDAVVGMLGSPNTASKRSVWRRYDHQVQNNTVAGPGGDAAIIRLKGTNKALALSTDGNGGWVLANPYHGAAAAVAEACRNVSCVGATPIAITDGLNYGDPSEEIVQYQLQESIAGIRDAANALGVPVVSGNASLYNESAESRILPTPIIGALGIINDVSKVVGPAFQDEGDYLFVLGSDAPFKHGRTGAFEALRRFTNFILGDIEIDLELEANVQLFCRELIAEGLIKSAHDCSSGGATVAIIESCVSGGIGAIVNGNITRDSNGELVNSWTGLDQDNWVWQLFGEAQSRIVVSAEPMMQTEIVYRAIQRGVPWAMIGVIGGESIRFPEQNIDVPLYMAEMTLETYLGRALGDRTEYPPPESKIQASLSQAFISRNSTK